MVERSGSRRNTELIVGIGIGFVRDPVFKEGGSVSAGSVSMCGAVMGSDSRRIGGGSLSTGAASLILVELELAVGDRQRAWGSLPVRIH